MAMERNRFTVMEVVIWTPPIGGNVLTFEKTRSFEYRDQTTQEVVYRDGVVAMSITCTEQGLKVHECNIYHMMSN